MDEAAAMVAQDAKAMASGDYLRFGIERVDTSALVGTCTLFSLNATCRRAELGYALACAAWGNGFMHEALTSLLSYGFTELNLNRVEADTDPKNHASAKSLKRLGFIREGLLRERWIVDGTVSDTALYGLLQRDWMTTR